MNDFLANIGKSRNHDQGKERHAAVQAVSHLRESVILSNEGEKKDEPV